MKSKWISTTILAGLLCLLLGGQPAQASTFTGSISDVSTLGISGFTVWLDVDSEFAFDGLVSQGAAVPTAWFADGNIGTVVMEGATRVAKIGYSDFIGSIPGNPLTPLGDGELFSFDFTGVINDLFLVKFATLADTDVYNEQVFLQSFDSSGVNFTGVPIPAAAWLLGTGLVGLVALRRRKK